MWQPLCQQCQQRRPCQDLVLRPRLPQGQVRLALALQADGIHWCVGRAIYNGIIFLEGIKTERKADRQTICFSSRIPTTLVRTKKTSQ